MASVIKCSLQIYMFSNKYHTNITSFSPVSLIFDFPKFVSIFIVKITHFSKDALMNYTNQEPFHGAVIIIYMT